MANLDSAQCPVVGHAAGPNVDTRKSAPLAAKNVKPDEGAHWVQNATLARALLRSAKAKQAGVGAEALHFENPEHAPVFFLDGLPHHKKRMAIAKFLSPKTVTTRHRDVMVRVTNQLLADFRKKGEARLESISFELAAEVVSDILGLTNSEQAARSRRVERAVRTSIARRSGGLEQIIGNIQMAYYTLVFFNSDVKPAIKARRKKPQDDVISHLLEEKYSDKGVLIECLTYGSAGMLTTREFIVMVAWYMFDRPELRDLYLAADEQKQLAILLEILRLEPVAAKVLRRVDEELTGPDGKTLPSGGLYAVDIRSVNTDEAMVGECPFALDPDRAEKMRENGRYMSFSDGSHNCPGWQVALHETRIFIDQLFRVPGLKLKHAPDIGWNPGVQGYELRNAIITCDKV